MANGQMQLAMEKNDARKGRDKRAIGWLVQNLKENVELEALASGVPGSFDTKWGVEVWKSDPATKDERTAVNPARPQAAPPGDGVRAPCPVLQTECRSRFSRLLDRANTLFSMRRQSGSQHPVNHIASLSAHPDSEANLQPSSPPPAYGGVSDELFLRIQRLLETCIDRGPFMNEDEWRKRSRGCVETVASFVCCLDANILSFGKIGKLLSNLGSAGMTRDLSMTSLNRPFTMRWTCLSLVETRHMLNSLQLQYYASGHTHTRDVHWYR